MEKFFCDIKKVNMYEAIADKLEEMILSDMIKADEKLPSEQSLATSFGVSRPVIREALMLLNARGLISQRNGEGAYISRPSTADFNRTVSRVVQLSNVELHSLFEVRLSLEVLSAQLAASHNSEDNIAELEKMIEKMSNSMGDNSNFARLDAKFHAEIAKMSGNRMLYLFISSLTQQITDMIENNLNLEGANEDACRYHLRLLEAIRSGSPEEASDIMRSHVIMAMRNAELASEKSASAATEAKEGA